MLSEVVIIQDLSFSNHIINRVFSIHKRIGISEQLRLLKGEIYSFPLVFLFSFFPPKLKDSVAFQPRLFGNQRSGEEFVINSFEMFFGPDQYLFRVTSGIYVVGFPSIYSNGESEKLLQHFSSRVINENYKRH